MLRLVFYTSCIFRVRGDDRRGEGGGGVDVLT